MTKRNAVRVVEDDPTIADGLSPEARRAVEANLSTGAASLLARLRASVEDYEDECNAEGHRWALVLLSNAANDSERSNRSFAGYLGVLTQAGLFRPYRGSEVEHHSVWAYVWYNPVDAGREPRIPRLPEADLPENTAHVLDILRAKREYYVEDAPDDCAWFTILLGACHPAGMSQRAYRGHLKALAEAGLYRPSSGKLPQFDNTAFGEVLYRPQASV